MENYDSGNKYNNYENQSASKYQSSQEKGGLVPVTANIINKSEISQDDSVEYQGVNIVDITAVGYIVDFKELDNKIKVTIYDYTGLLEINFYNRQENLDSIGFDKFKYEGKREPVKVFATVKVFKGNKIIQGAKIIKSDSNNVLYHRANVIHSWLYLTGKLKAKNNINFSVNKNEEKNEPTINNNRMNTEKKSENFMEEAINIIKNYSKNDSMIKERKLEELLRKFGSKSKDIINKLVDYNILIETDGAYEIII